jgi:CO/xanthine dehydrogenase Mo-binding subunit
MYPLDQYYQDIHSHTMGSYDIPNFYTEVRMVFTNMMVVAPVCGAGRTSGVFVLRMCL